MSDKKIEIIKDFSGQGLNFRQSQRVDQILDLNKQDQNNSAPTLGFGRKVASIPTIVLDRWLAEEGLDWRKCNSDPEMAKRLKAKLNDPEWRALRTNISKV
jgi:hypothetical protein